MSKPTLMSSTAQPVELREVVAGEAEQPRDDVDRERERELAHEVGAAAVDERVDVLVDDRARRASVSQRSIALRLNACCTSPR